MERLSTQTQESGFVSMHSQRSSSQSYSATNLVTKRSSQQSSSSSLSYNSQSLQTFAQQRLSAGEPNGNGYKSSTTTMTSSRSMHSATNITGDPSFMEKLVYVGVAWFCFLIYFSNFINAWVQSIFYFYYFFSFTCCHSNFFFQPVLKSFIRQIILFVIAGIIQKYAIFYCHAQVCRIPFDSKINFIQHFLKNTSQRFHKETMYIYLQNLNYSLSCFF